MMSELRLDEKTVGLLQALLERVKKAEPCMQILSVATLDGFHIASAGTVGRDVNADRLAAAVSTVGSLTSSLSQHTLGVDSDVTILETANGNALIVRTSFLGLACALILVVDASMSLGQVRFHAKRLAGRIPQFGQVLSAQA